MLFPIAFSKVTQKFDQRCVEAGLTLDVSAAGSADYLGCGFDDSNFCNQSVTYVHDLCKSIVCAAEDAVPNIVAITNSIVKTFFAHGFTPNFAPGESEAMVHFGGPGSRDSDKILVVDMDSSVPAH
eukprot:7454601-Karenia_brevis.AAC.1